jgi:hypothetical protein
MFRANYPVDNPSDYWKISLIPYLLGNLGSFSGRDIKASSKQRGVGFFWRGREHLI